MRYSYWKRTAIDGIIYFAAEADSPAETAAQNDKEATQISKQEYEANVPDVVHNGADRTQEIDPKDAAWHNLLVWQSEAKIPLPDQVAMLEVVSFNLKMALSQAIIKPRGSENNAT